MNLWRQGGRVLVTGGAGFIGHHFVEYLLEETAAEVVILDRLSGAGDQGRLAALDCWERERARVRLYWHDLKAPIGEALAHRIGKVDAIVHFAASSHVDTSISDPALFVLDNVLGTTNLLTAARTLLADAGLFINFSTDEVFGPVSKGEPAKTETDAWRPSNPYSASKAGQTAMGWAFHRTFDVPVLTTYCLNVFGERQHVEKYVPRIIRAVLSGEELTVHIGPDGRPGSRTWLHAANVAEAVAHILDIGKAGDAYNIVTADERDNLQVAQAVASALGKPLHYKTEAGDVSRPGYDARYSIDGSRLAASGWKPSLSFQDGLERTVRWTAAHREWVGL